MKTRRSGRNGRFAAGALACVGAASLLIGTAACSRPPKNMVWLVAIDVSKSTDAQVAANWLDTVKKRMVPQTILCRLKGDDEVLVTPIDASSGDSGSISERIQYISVFKGVRQSIGVVHRRIVDEIKVDDRGGSDFGGACSWVSANVRRIRGEKRRNQPNIAVLIFTDGFADGQQQETGPIPADVDVSIWGTVREPQVLRKGSRKEIADSLNRVESRRLMWDTLASAGVARDRVRHMPIGDWESAARTFDPFGRRAARELIEKL
jgi:hypothetical protein